MGKYEQLGQFLRKQKSDRITMKFGEIEKIIGNKLPKSKVSRAFWSNNPDNNVMTREWIKAGFETTEVDIKKGELVFRKRAAKNKRTGKDEKTPWEELYGCMKGMITYAPDFDPTAPSFDDEAWGDSSIGGYHDRHRQP